MHKTIHNIKSYLDIHADEVIKHLVFDLLHDKQKLEQHPYVSNIMNIDRLTGIHGRKDTDFENIMSRLLDLGYDKNHLLVDQLSKQVLNLDIWCNHEDFDQEIRAVVAYPFLIRAGYMNEKVVHNYFYKRLKKIEDTIKYRGYNFFESIDRKDENQSLIFNINPKEEALPTIYDLYAWAYVDINDQDLSHRINEIVLYIVDQRFQLIPEKAYIKSSKRSYKFAAGSVYHAVNIKQRKVLFASLLSRFSCMKSHTYMQNILNEFDGYRDVDGLYAFPKSYLKEKKDQYHLYSGAHMSFGESKNARHG
ncbi:hypothetical protein BK011_02625 [Tenericutes bacterium MZ-XQ]|nr:hypothetical protein BK011_02625 [Tenericutes bacterium MZ-XQ]